MTNNTLPFCECGVLAVVVDDDSDVRLCASCAVGYINQLRGHALEQQLARLRGGVPDMGRDDAASWE